MILNIRCFGFLVTDTRDENKAKTRFIKLNRDSYPFRKKMRFNRKKFSFMANT